MSNINPGLIKPYMSAQALEYVEALEKTIEDLTKNGLCKSCDHHGFCRYEGGSSNVCSAWVHRKDVSL